MGDLFSRFLVVFIASLCSTPAIYSYTIRPRRLWYVFSIILPIVLFTLGVINQNIIILLLGISSLTTLIASWLHREHVIKLRSAGDNAVGTGLIAFIFLGLEIGNLSKEFLLQMYSGLFQACLATLGIVFAIAVFTIEIIQNSDVILLRPMLYGLGKYLALITITSLIGMLYSNEGFSFGYSIFTHSESPLSATMPIWNLPTLQTLIFFFSLIMFFSMVGYLIVLLKIILKVKDKKSSQYL